MRYDDEYYDEWEYDRPARKTKKKSSGQSSAKRSNRDTRSTSDAQRSKKRTSQSGKTSRYETDGRSRSASSARKSTAAKKTKKSRKRRNLGLMIAIEAILLVVVVAAVFVISKFNKIQTPSWGKLSIQHNEDMDEAVLQSMGEGYTDIMIFGVDGAMVNGRGNTLDRGTGADVNILAHINNATGEITLVSLFRDFYMSYDGDYKKLTDIYRAGGAEAALNAINRTMDLNVNQFVTVNWAATANVINMMGGVDIDVPDIFLNMINGLITETVEGTGIGSNHLTQGGYQHLDGIQTVAYCRIRKIDLPGYDFGDFGRAERQREILNVLLQKAKTMDLGRLNSIADAILPEIYSNLSLTDILGLVMNYSSYSIKESVGFPYEKETPDAGGLDVVVAIDLYSNVYRLHQALYGTEDGYQVSPTVEKISNDMLYRYGY